MQWNLYYADTLGTFPGDCLIVKIAQYLLTINIQQFLYNNLFQIFN